MTRYLTYLWLSAMLVMSLGNCAKRQARRETFQGSLGYCGNSILGDFDVILNPSQTAPGLFELRIVTIAIAQPGGSFVRVALANDRLEYVEKVQYARIRPDRVLFQGLVSPEELELYNLIVIAPYKGGTATFLESLSEDDEAICRVPSTDTTDVVPGNGNIPRSG